MIDFAKIKEYGLSERESIIVFTLIENKKVSINKMISIFKPNEEDINNLIEKKVIKDGSTIDNLSFTDSFLGKNRDYFNEFLSEYPTVVVRPDGTKDYLKTSLSRCKLSYISKIITLEDHENAMKGLRNNIKSAVISDKMKFFKKLINYIRDEEWIGYMDEDMQEQSSFQNRFGEEIE